MSQQQLRPRRLDHPITMGEVAPKAALGEEDIGRPVTKEDAADVQCMEAQIIGEVSRNRSDSKLDPNYLSSCVVYSFPSCNLSAQMP